MKKIFASLAGIGLLLGTALPVMAQESQPFQPFWKFAHATPGHPVTLEGKGEARAHGRGKIHYRMDNGQVRLTGQGVVAVKGTNDVHVFGLGGKVQVGEWTYYYGRGTLKVTGSNYDVVFWGKAAHTAGKGSGKVTYRGFWTIKYHGVNTSGMNLESIPLPDDLKSQAGTDGELE